MEPVFYAGDADLVQFPVTNRQVTRVDNRDMTRGGSDAAPSDTDATLLD
jgi:hypothetical protein